MNDKETHNRIEEIVEEVIERCGDIWKGPIDIDFIRDLVSEIVTQEMGYQETTDPSLKDSYFMNLELLQARMSEKTAPLKGKLVDGGLEILKGVLIAIIVEVIKNLVGLH